MQALLEARDDGRVRFPGITGHHDPAILLEAMRRFEVDTVLAALNAADRHRLPFIETVLPVAAVGGMGVIAMKVDGGGSLVGPSGSPATSGSTVPSAAQKDSRPYRPFCWRQSPP